MNKIVFIVGESGCGKTYLRDKLLKNNSHKYCEIRSTVSRPARKGEDVNAYHFVRRNEFEKLIDNNSLLQYVEWGGNYYGTTINEYARPQETGLFICTPVGISDTMKALKKNNIKMEFSILLFLTTKDLLKKHKIPKERIDRGNILEEFLKRHSDNEFKGAYIDIIQDEDVDDNLYRGVHRSLQGDY